MRPLRRRRRRSGFTLMEILLVLAILVVLGSLVTWYFVGIQKSSYSDVAKVQIDGFEMPLQKYYLDCTSYPSTQTGLSALIQQPGDLRDPNKWKGPYLNKQEIPPDPWGNPYQYELVSGDQYRIWSFGADSESGTDDDITSG